MFVIDRILVDDNKYETNISCAGSTFVITKADFERLNLNEGDEISDELYEELCESETRLACIKKSFTYLSYGDMSAKKMSDKLCAKFDKDIVSDVVELLKERKYLNDAVLAVKYAKSFYEFKLWGPARIKSDLYKRGFLREDINASCEFLEENDHRENIQRIITNKYGVDPEKILIQKQKICAYLYRMGYSYSDITDVISSISDLIN